MKNSLLVLITVVLVLQVYAQSPCAFTEKDFQRAVKAQYTFYPDELPADFPGYNTTGSFAAREIANYQVGTTTYDQQSNYIVSNKIQYYPQDNSIGLVWMKGEVPEEFNDRGTAYNYFNGSSWLAEPAARIESEKTGWPTYARWGAEGEMVIAHLPQGLMMSTRPQRGTGSWTVSSILQEPADPTWARVVSTGESHQTIHILASSYDPYMGQDKALLYFRSIDGGETWDIPGIVPDGTGEEFYTFVQQDSYAWAEPRANTLAYVCCSAWHDMFIMKSTDGGDTWEKTVVWEHPYPFFDFETTLTDTFFCVDNSASIAIDNDGKVHLAFGINRVLHNEAGTGYWLFYLVDGIGYWNEDMPAFSDDIDALCPPQYQFPNSELIEDYNYVGWTQDVDGDGEITLLQDVYYYNTIGLSTMPAITIDENNKIFIVYASTTETYDNFQYNYKHIWARAYDEVAGWTGFIHVSSDIIHLFDECIYPVLASKSNDYLHLVYQADATPGTAIDDEHVYQENRMTYARVNKFEFYPWKITERSVPLLEVSQNYPNPFSKVTYLKVNLRYSGPLSVEVWDITGQQVKVVDKGYVTTGSHLFTLDREGLSSGIYFYTVRAGNQLHTGKMTVK